MKRFPFRRIVATAAIALITVAQAMAVTYSGTIPVVFVTTENGQAITSKEDYINATYYIDPMQTSFEAVGSNEAQLPTQIRGRGNYTWTGFDKKPYKLKLAAKTKLLGMGKNKHWALLAHADDNLAFLRNTVGFELSRMFGLPWTPSVQPVELVLNGEYQGLYFLTETVRVDSNRVNIVEQPDNISGPAEDITGGWLVEIDNYDTDPHVEITEGNGERIIFTYKTPEILSTAQEDYLRSQMTAINSAIYASDKSTAAWTDYVDIDNLARYYLVQEIMDDGESFHGSCYMNRDRGFDQKWKFGPVWDFGNSFQRESKNWIYQDVMFNQTWIGEISKFPAFQDKVKELWVTFASTRYGEIEPYVNEFIDYISDAAASNAERWPQYGNSDLSAGKSTFLSRLRSSVSWLGSKLGYVPVEPVTVYLRGDFNGWGVDKAFTEVGNGVYKLNNVSFSGEFKIASSDWSTIDYGANTTSTEVYLNEPYILTPNGKNMKGAEDFENVNLTFDINGPTLLVTPYNSGISSVVTNEGTVSVDGLRIMAHGMICVYNPAGVLVAQGVEGTEVTSPGLYIVKAYGKTFKISIR